MCGFSAGFMQVRGGVQAGTMWGGAGVGWQYLVRAVGWVTRTLCRSGAGQQLCSWGECGSEISARAELNVQPGWHVHSHQCH